MNKLEPCAGTRSSISKFTVLSMFLCLPLMALLNSCASVPADMSKLSLGMTRTQVSSSLGTPGIRSSGASGEEKWIYYYNTFGRVYAGALSTKSCLEVIFNGDRAIYWQEACRTTPKNIYHEQNGTITVGVDLSKWLLSLRSLGFKVVLSAEDRQPGYFLWGKNEYFLSVIIEPVPNAINATSCRDRSIAKIKIGDPESYQHKTWENGEVAFSEYISTRKGERRLHLNKHIVQDGLWYDIHFSKGAPIETDKNEAIAYLESIRLVQKPQVNGQ